MTARGPFTPFAFLLLLLHHFHLLRLPLLPRRRLPPPGTAVLVTLAATFWLSSVVVPMFLVLELLLSTSAMRASLVAMFDFPFLFLLRMRRMPSHAFNLVHCDLWTSPVLSISSYKYYLVVVDDFSHYSWSFPLRAKS